MRELGLSDSCLCAHFLQTIIGALGTSIHVKNTGQTPAYDISLFSTAKFDQLALTEPLPALRKEALYTLGPGQFVTHQMTADPVLTAPQLLAIQNGTAKYFLFGSLKYRDAFGTNRETTFRLEYTNDSVNDGHLRISEEGNQAS